MDIHQLGLDGLDGLARDGSYFWIVGSPFNLAKFFYVSHAIHANGILINLFAAAPAGMAARFTAGLVHVPSRTLRMRFTGRRHATPPCMVA